MKDDLSPASPTTRFNSFGTRTGMTSVFAQCAVRFVQLVFSGLAAALVGLAHRSASLTTPCLNSAQRKPRSQYRDGGS